MRKFRIISQIPQLLPETHDIERTRIGLHDGLDVAIIQQHEDLYLRLLRPGSRIPCSIAYCLVDGDQIMLIWISQGAAQDCLNLRHNMLVVSIIACPLELMMLRKSHTETFFLSYRIVTKGMTFARM